MIKYRFPLHLQLFAEDEVTAETVVHDPVDADLWNEIQNEQNEASTTAEATDTGETQVDNGTVDASTPDPKVGEAIRREVERREAKLKEQYEQQYGPITQHSEALKRRARQEGYGDDVAGYLRAIDDLEQRMEATEAAKRMGIDPQAYQQHIAPVNQEVRQLRETVAALTGEQERRQQQEVQQSKWGALYEAFPGLMESAKAFNEGKNPEWYNEKMQAYIDRGYDPVDAYQLANADTLALQREQDVLARLTGRAERQILPSKDSPNNVQFDPANMTDKQLEELSERVRQGERIVL